MIFDIENSLCKSNFGTSRRGRKAKQSREEIGSPKVSLPRLTTYSTAQCPPISYARKWLINKPVVNISACWQKFHFFKIIDARKGQMVENYLQ